MSTQVRVDTGAADTTRRRSNLLWKDFDWDRAQLGAPEYATFFYDDFRDLPTGKYTATQATAGTFALGLAEDYGVALADCNSTTAAQGINVQLPGEKWKPVANEKVIFEARFKVVDAATGPEFFIGLHEIKTDIISGSALDGSNMVGLSSVTDDLVCLFTAEKAGTADNHTGTTLVDGTWIKWGFVIDGVTGITQYINGVKQASSTDHVTANIPIVPMTLSLVCQSGGTTDPIVHLDWWACGQIHMFSG